MNDEAINRILDAIDEERIRDLARCLVMIPSVGYISRPVVQNTAECVAFCGECLERLGCEIAVQEDIGKQVIGTLKGTGNGRVSCSAATSPPSPYREVGTWSPMGM